MPNFGFSPEELLVFFAVLVRFATLSAVLPIIGDRMVPSQVKILFGLAVSIALFPSLVKAGDVKIGDAYVWGGSAWGIVVTITLEALTGLVLGFTSKLCFDAISIGSNLAGNFMGFAMASQYDPHQESQSQVMAEIQMAIAMLIFLALDGHHLMLRAAFESYSIVGVGKAAVTELFSNRLISMLTQVFSFGIQIAGPVAVSIFAVNVGFGVLGKALPQLNILSLSMGVTAMVGLIVMYLAMPEFASASANVLERMGDWMRGMLSAMVGHG